ncbi:MAG: translation initiation factor IF-2 [Pirellulales bacterium]|nr:translation initiation factor IF-2 [Pirellulales bacterium]
MPIRIYALAKQLKLDSKTLVDICNDAGVTGKGSALASLTDEELEKVKAQLASGGRTGARSGSATVAPAPQRPKAADAGTFRREDYVSPSGTIGGKVPVLPAKGDKAPQKPAGEPTAPAEKTAPAIKLAPMPTSQQPPAAAKPKEPAAQKPDIKLPLDAIRAGRLGEKPLAEELEKHEKRHRAATKKAAPPQAPVDDAAAAPLSTDRGRRTGRRPVAAEADAGETLLGGREQRQLKRKRAPSRRQKGESEEDSRTPRRTARRIRRTGTNTAAPRKSHVVVALPCTVRTFSEAIGMPAGRVLGKLLSLGAGAGLNINAELEPEMAELLAVELGAEVDFRRQVDLETQLLPTVEQDEEDPATLEPRPPIITFLGHVDHGKTSLLDRILAIDIVSGEKGGITQHIRAYQVRKGDRAISFVDTPGHEAFTEMRARGANVTDIAVLVVAADDGVMPQTEEAISHARAAGVPIVVALNKIDLPGVDVQRTYQQLAANELLPAEWGGEIEVVKTSAVTGEGIDALLETLLTVAELQEFKANPNRPAFGTCLEAELHEDRGVVAKVLVEQGTLHVGDVVVCGSAYGRVKAMYDTLDFSKQHATVGPSMPVNVTGLSEAPGAGDRFHVVPEISQARQIAEHRAAHARQQSLAGGPVHVTLENLFDRLGHKDEVQTLNIILRADVRGSIEAIRKELTKLQHPEVQIKILQATVGGITEADVHLADASDAVIIGFSVVPDESARQLAEARGVQIRRYDIIYQVTDDLKAALEGMLKPEKREADLGRALVQRTFQISRVGTIAGCRVMAGTIQRDSRVRLIRENRVAGDYPLESLRREKDDVREVREGMECGIKLRGYNDLKEGDILEVYRIEEIRRTF